MSMKEQYLNDMRELISFAKSLQQLDDEKWTEAIAEGKWTVRDIVSHIMLWDEYYLEHSIAPLASNLPITAGHPEFDEFNRNAAEYGKTQTKQHLLERTIACRNQIIEHLSNIPEYEYDRSYADGHFTIKSYIEDFVQHDRHHMAQIKKVVGI